MEKVVGWERQPQGSQQGRQRKQQVPSSSRVHVTGAGLMQRTSGAGAGTYFDGAVQRSHAVTPPPLPCTHKQGAQRQSSNPPPHPAGLQSWAPSLGPSRGQTPLIPFPPLKRGLWGGGEVEKEEQKEEEMEEEERWYRRNRRGKRGGEVEQQRGAKTMAPLHTPWPKLWAPSVLTWLPGPLQHSAQGSE